jgi:nitrate reductase gamma subunit
MTTDGFAGGWPYVAFGVAGAAFLVRLLTAARRFDVMQRDAAEARTIFAGTLAWCIAASFLLVTHVLLLALPRAILAWNAAPLRLYLLEGTSFLLGGIAVGAWVDVMWRHVTRPSSSAKSAVADSVFLGLLLVAIASGFLMQTLFRWASSWGAMTLAPYLGSLVHGHPREELVDEMPFLVRLHVISSFAALASFPFSRASLLLIAVFYSLFAPARRPIGHALAWLDARWKERIAPLIWAEDENRHDTDPDIAPPAWTPGRSGIVLSPAAAQDAGPRDTFDDAIDQAR